MASIRVQRLELGGVRTRALELHPEGEASGPGIVLLHGFSDSADCWRGVLSRLARGCRRAVALDLPGFGEAARLDREREILPQLDGVVAAAVERAASASGTGGVIVCGNSLGGTLALRAAEREELPIEGVVPIAPAGLDMAGWFGVIEGAGLVRFVLRAPVPLPATVVRESVGRAYRMLAFARPGEVDPGICASFTRHVRSRRDVVRILATGRSLLPELRSPFHLERIACPVLVVWGDRDRMVYPSGAERIVAEVPGARLELIADCGHCPQIEAPERLSELLLEFPAALASAA